MKSVLLTGIVIDEKSRSVFNYFDSRYIMYDVMRFTGLDLLTLESVEVSISSLGDTVINPPLYCSDSYRVSVTDYFTPIDLFFRGMQSCNKLSTCYCRLLNSEGKELSNLYDWLTLCLCGEVFIEISPVAKSVKISTSNKYIFVHPMFAFGGNQSLASVFKSAFLTELSSGLYEHGDTAIVTLENKNKDIILPESTKKLVIEASNNISSIVFNKNIDDIDSIGRAKIKRIGISKEASHKQLSIITKFIMDSKNITDAEFDDNFKWEMCLKCCDILRENKSLANEIYNDIEVVVY